MTSVHIESPVALAELGRRVFELEREVTRLRAIDDIKSLHRRYIRFLADRDWVHMHDMFDDDVVTDISFNGITNGKAELLAVFDRLSKMSVAHDAYVLSSPVVKVDGERATGEWTWHRHYCELLTRQGAAVNVWGPWMEGRYRCQYVKRDGEWKFIYLWFRTVAPDPGADDRLKELRSRQSEPSASKA
jgi:SnoaL-like domain